MAEGSAPTTYDVQETTAPGPLNKLGVLLTRVVVPLWILAGATFKLIEHTPRLLPETVRLLRPEFEFLTLHKWLSILVGLELLAIGVMFFSRRFARLMAIFMLSCFCLILLNELRLGNLKDCGCFGKVAVPPWLTLTIDGALLIGVLIFAPRYITKGWSLAAQLGAAAVFAIAGFALSFALVLPHDKRVEPQPDPPPTQPTNGGAPAPNDTPRQLTGLFYIDDAEALVGQNWSDVQLFQFITDWPDGMNDGRRYVIFYLRSCEHCRDLLEAHFDDEPPVPTVLVAIPDSTEGFDTGAELTMFYCETCVEHRELPVGPDWLLTGPVVVALEDGIIRCIKEGEDYEEPECLIWH